jgi:hypothetical protein
MPKKSRKSSDTRARKQRELTREKRRVSGIENVSVPCKSSVLTDMITFPDSLQHVQNVDYWLTDEDMFAFFTKCVINVSFFLCTIWSQALTFLLNSDSGLFQMGVDHITCQIKSNWRVIYLPYFENNHWMLFVINRVVKDVLFVDPLGGPIRNNGIVAVNKFLSIILNNDALQQYKFRVSVNHPLQKDSSSCGAWVCQLAYLHANNIPWDSYDASSFDLRHQIVQLYNSPVVTLPSHGDSSDTDPMIDDSIATQPMTMVVHDTVTASVGNEVINPIANNENYSDCSLPDYCMNDSFATQPMIDDSCATQAMLMVVDEPVTVSVGNEESYLIADNENHSVCSLPDFSMNDSFATQPMDTNITESQMILELCQALHYDDNKLSESNGLISDKTDLHSNLLHDNITAANPSENATQPCYTYPPCARKLDDTRFHECMTKFHNEIQQQCEHVKSCLTCLECFPSNLYQYKTDKMCRRCKRDKVIPNYIPKLITVILAYNLSCFKI